MHGAKGAASRRHANREDPCGEEKVKAGLALSVGPLGPLSIVVSGAGAVASVNPAPDGGVEASASAAGHTAMIAARRIRTRGRRMRRTARGQVRAPGVQGLRQPRIWERPRM